MGLIMATDNKGVTVYLPQDVEECLTQYCIEYGITRKAKDGTVTPSLGTGIVTYLKEKMMGADPSVRSSGLGKAQGNGLTLDDVRSLIDPLASDLVNLQSQIINRDNWDDLKADVADLRHTLTEALASIKGASIGTQTDFDPAAIQIYIDQQIEELRAQITAIGAKPASIATTPAKPSTTKKPLTQCGQSSAQEMEVQKWANRLKANPQLKAAIEEGLGQNLTGKGLTEWVFSKGFGANENTKPFDSSVAARMRGAIEYLSGAENNG
jgi:hypothetical protein